MAPVVVKVNTYINKKHNAVDSLTKILVASGTIVGLNRTQLLGSAYSKTIYVASLVWSIVLIIGGYVALRNIGYFYLSLMFSEYIFCVVMCYVTRKQLHLFFLHLNKFDAKVRCCPKTGHILRLNKVLYLVIVMSVVSTTLFLYCLSCYAGTIAASLAPLRFLHIIEHVLFAHLLSNLYPRLKLISHCMELSLSKCKNLDLAAFQRGFENYAISFLSS